MKDGQNSEAFDHIHFSVRVDPSGSMIVRCNAGKVVLCD